MSSQGTQVGQKVPRPEKERPPGGAAVGETSALVKAPAESTSAIACEYIRTGLVLVPIPHVDGKPSKGPTGKGAKGWNMHARCWSKVEQVPPSWTGNVGLAHAYSRTAALDVDNVELALPVLYKLGIDLPALLADKDAVQIRSGKPNRAKLLYRLPAGVEPLPSVDRTDAGEGFEFRCGTRAGLTVQDVLPPSLHPDTGCPYEWVGHWRNLPELPAQVLAAWRSCLRPQSKTGTTDARNVVSEGRHADVLRLAARVARMVVREGLGYDAGLALLKAEQARGRWSRDVTDELHRAYRDAFDKLDSGVWSVDRPRSEPVPDDSWPPALVDQSAHQHTDHANAHRLVRNFGADMLNVTGLGWHAWVQPTGPWRRDEMAARRTAARLGRIVLDESRTMLDAAARLEDDEARKQAVAAGEARAKWARQCESRGTINSALEMAAPLLNVKPEQVDNDPLLLGCRNGVLDLRTGKLRAYRRDDFITQCCATDYVENAQAPVWERFVREVFGGDRELVEWVQRFLGYCLTGQTTEHMLVVAHGAGSNGKTTLFECFRLMLGDYGKTAAPGLLIARKGERHPTEILDLRGARLVCSSETGEGGRLAEDLVKQLTGGDGLKGRGMRQDFVEFKPTFKLVLFTNHRPLITGQDHGIWRRIRLLPFAQTFEGERKDKDLPAKLFAELPGILRWCVEGLISYQREGFSRCAAIEAASSHYRTESDLLGQFIEEECVTAPDCSQAAGDIYSAYVTWAKDNGVQPLAKRTLGLRLDERGFRSHKGTGGVRRWQGLRLRQPAGRAEPWTS